MNGKNPVMLFAGTLAVSTIVGGVLADADGQIVASDGSQLAPAQAHVNVTEEALWPDVAANVVMAAALAAA